MVIALGCSLSWHVGQHVGRFGKYQKPQRRPVLAVPVECVPLLILCFLKKLFEYTRRLYETRERQTLKLREPTDFRVCPQAYVIGK
jgi:hypothetical protein